MRDSDLKEELKFGIIDQAEYDFIKQAKSIGFQPTITETRYDYMRPTVTITLTRKKYL